MEISDEEVVAKFKGISLSPDNLDHFRGLLARRLLINRCQECGYWIYPHRPMCPKCWSDSVSAEEVSGKGTLYLWTAYHDPSYHGGPPRVEGYPFPVGAAELPERKALRYVAPIVNCPLEEIQIGLPVEITWQERDGVPFPAWQPAPGALENKTWRPVWRRSAELL